MALPQYLSKIRQLIANDELPAALQQLRALLENSPKLDEVIQQSGRFNHIRKQIRLGTVHFEDATVTRNQISAALLELLSEIEKEGVKPELAAEVEKAISIVNSKNAISNSNIDAGRDIHIGDKIINYGERKIPRLLTDPPFIPGLFLGRTDDLRRIQEQLFAPNGHLLLLVNGEGGVGKTSIASQYFHIHQEKYAHVAWVFSEKNIASALLQLAIPLGLQFDERADALDRLRILIQAMFDLKKPCLLIIDNANELNELRTYLPHLQRCSNFHILFTTRISDYPQVNFYKIEPLPQDLALQAFKSHYQAFEASEENLFFDIYTAVQGNTLVLELLAKNLNNFNNKLKKRYLLSDLKRDLEKSLLGLSKSEKVQTIYQGLREESPESIIAAMYELGDLPTEESTLLSVFAVLPAESIPFERLETLLPDHAELDTHLLALAQKGWIEYNADVAAFKCSPVVQEVVRLKRGDLLENCASLIKSLCTQLDSENLHLDNYQHSTLFVRYAEAVLGSFAIAVDDLGTLCQNIGIYYTDTGDLGKALIAYQKMETIQAELLKTQPDDADFKNGLAISYSKLGDTHRDLGNLQQALTFFEDSNTLEKELYAAYPQNVSFKNGLAISYLKLGQTQSALGNLQQALTFFEDYNTLEKELCVAYPQNVEFKNNLAISYNFLGNTYKSLGQLEPALENYKSYNKISEELYEAFKDNVKYKNDLAISYEKLGETHSALGNLQQALTFFEDSNTLEKELYAAYPQNVSFKYGLQISYEKLGDTHLALSKIETAQSFYEKENQLLEELYAAYPQNVSFKNGLAISYEKLGQTHRNLGNLQQALTFFEDETKLFEDLYAAYPQNVSFKNGLAISYSRLGKTHSDLGNLQQASTFFEVEIKLFEELYATYPQNVAFKNGLALSFQWLGWFLEQKLQNLEKAKECYHASKLLLEELVTSFPDYPAFKVGLDWVIGKLKD